MSRFTKFSIYCLFMGLLWGLMWYFKLLPFYLLIGLAVVYISTLVYYAIHIQCNFFIRSINSLSDVNINTSEKKICLSFDDGIHPEYTTLILDILKTNQVKAMFFLIGKNLSGQSHILQRIKNEEHVIGNHSFSHGFWFDMKSTKDMMLDIQQANQLIQDECGIQPKYFRPPYGVTNPNLAKAINRLGMKSVGWNLRSMDTVAKSNDILLNKLKKETAPNCIVLLHDRCQITAEVLTDYIAYCKSEGYTFVTI